MSSKPHLKVPEPQAALASTESPASDLSLTLEVEPRKPRLAWQGMERKGMAASVPTQVVEIVRPGRAVERKGELDLAARAPGREEVVKPENRLIWTNDNLVALQTLLDERDPKTRDYQYRGKVDLVYIDPPFMVNNDFLADNAVEIDLDDEAGVQAKKEPSLVEILAYKDTWRQGLDSFLSMLKARLVLLRQLLASTGSIYVHLDWHTAHYVKVLMDEVFGYERFQSEVIWKRTGARADTVGINHVHDVLLVYAAGPSPIYNARTTPHDPAYVRQHYSMLDKRGRFQPITLMPPGIRNGETGRPWRGFDPSKKKCHWKYTPTELDRLDAEGFIYWPKNGGTPRLKQYLRDLEGVPIQSIWLDIPAVNSQASERLGYPTQKPVSLLERIVATSSPVGGLVLDCFLGSGTTTEAAERLERRWIGIDNGKYAIHLARKRLIQLHGQTRPPEKSVYDYVECEECKNIDRKEKPMKSPGPYAVRPFTVENMGVYQRASEWQGFQQHRSAYRDEMIKVFGGEPVDHSPLLHGRKGDTWVHVGPLDGPVASAQVWSIAREAQRTSTKAVTVLSADFDTLSASDKDEIKKKTGVVITIRVIPANAIDEVKRRLDLQRANPNLAVESTAIPAFYAPLSIVLEEHVSGKNVELRLKRCEVDIESFIASQRPILKPITDKMTAAAKKKAQGEIDRWEKRERELNSWLKKATSWRAFVDFWAIDWNYGRQVGDDSKPIFITEWQSFRNRDGDGELVFAAKFSYPQAGHYRIAARVTDVFGNDGIATVDVEVKR
jgi:adenine-specific DNA-methyltransferase